jgi:HlyD family secretion protein
MVSGQIEGIAVHIGSRVGGRVAEVYVAEGQSVKRGDVLLRFEDAELRAMYEAAQAQTARAEAALALLERGATQEQREQAAAAARAAEQRYRLLERGAREEDVRSAEALLSAAQTKADVARRDFERVASLLEQGAVPQQTWDRAKAAWDAAQAEQRAAEERLRALRNGARPEEIRAAKAAWEQAEAVVAELRAGATPEEKTEAQAAVEAGRAEVRRLAALLEEMTVRAPNDGIIESLDLRPGDLVKPGPIGSITHPDELELKIYVSAPWLGFLRVGQALEFTTDAHGSERFQGRIVYIAPRGEFTPRNLQTQEERVQQVFAVKMKLDAAGGKLRPGMTATVYLHAANDL